MTQSAETGPVARAPTKRKAPGYVATRARKAKARGQNEIAYAMRYLPASVKQEWAADLKGHAKTAFSTLLVGSSHVCPNCQMDFSRVGSDGHVFACGCERPNVHAVRLYCELTGDVGPANQVMVNFVQSLGVADVPQAQLLIDLGRRHQRLTNDASLSPKQCLEEALELAAACLAVLPEERARALARLGG